MSNYIKISFNNTTAEQKDVLVARLSDIQFEGFEEGHSFLLAFIQENEFNEPLLRDVAADLGLHYEKELVPQQNWNKSWEENFQPVVVDDFCCIRAAFHPPATGVKYDIIITPKMSFGTGHHATTFLMIQSMSKIDHQHKSVLDFGTGTGLLAILAEKLGAEKVLGIDNDDWSIENAAENIADNNCTKIRVKEASTISTDQKFDIILANINKNVLLTSMPLLKQQLQNDGVVVMSGLLKGDRQQIEEMAELNGLKLYLALEKDAWIALQFSHMI
ncbi:MAG: 50S ribosomal protein L11 methyltransferase [Chitinophagaceae bacterium]|nr:50S ribosomal protein L11 methyltransferase [Chitinophagaceae bacterium]